MARNRCSYEKRAKEIARKQKQEEKIKRRQNKLAAKGSEESPDLEPLDAEPTRIETTEEGAPE